MTAAVLSDTNLLPYIMNTAPNPLKISTALEPRLGKLEIEVGRRSPTPLVPTTLIPGDTGDGGGALPAGRATEPVWCKKIEVRFSIGDGATDLTDSQNIADVTASIIPNGPPPDWRLNKRVADGEVIITVEAMPNTPVRFTGENSYVLVINKIAVNRAAGEAVIRIIEETSTTRDSGYQTREATRPAAKVSDEFYFYDLRPDKPAVTLTEFPVLSWQGNRDNTAFTVLWHDGEQQQSCPANGISWSPPEPPQNTTTYLVRAEHTPEGQTTPLYRYLAVTVIVINPNIVANNVTVKGTLSGEPGKQLTVSGELKVNGMIEAPGGITGEKKVGGKQLGVHYNGLDIHTNLAVGTQGGGSGSTTFYHDVQVAGGKKLTVSGNLQAGKLRNQADKYFLNVHTPTSDDYGYVVVRRDFRVAPKLAAGLTSDPHLHVDHEGCRTTVRIKASNGIEGTSNAPLRVHQNAGLQVDAYLCVKGNLDAGAYTDSGKTFYYLNVNNVRYGGVRTRRNFQLLGRVNETVHADFYAERLDFNGNVVLCNNSTFRLYNTYQSEYLYAANYAPYDKDRRRVFTWRPGNPITEGTWRAVNASTPSSLAVEQPEPEAVPETPPEDNPTVSEL